MSLPISKINLNRITLRRFLRRFHAAGSLSADIDELNNELATYFGPLTSRSSGDIFPKPKRLTVAEIPGHLVKKTSVRKKKRGYDEYPPQYSGSDRPSVLVLHGASSFFNNLLVGISGIDEIRGKDQVFKQIEDTAATLGLHAKNVFSNCEGRLLDELSSNEYSALILNPGQLSPQGTLHKSFKLLTCPIVLVTMENELPSNVYAGSANTAMIRGLGILGYKLAVNAVAEMLNR